ncbi:MAG: peptide chain release factor N(5)-glutamine methyltransferase [Clostridiales bacterium]|nr:peptide chain release factor N(5)-glutamine methyltransferase [Clostridiales bacterium]
MTRTDIIRRLRAAGIDNPENEALILISEVCSISVEKIIRDRDTDYCHPALTQALSRREQREPLQYIIGKWPFCSEIYFVSPDCLIPRADTEMLVYHAAEKLPPGAYFADLCTGSGCIAISILAKRPDCSAIAVDISRGALNLARKNAILNDVEDRIQFYEHDLLCDTEYFLPPDRTFDAIISNPPYVKSTDIDKLAPELAYEPRIALDGGADGMAFYQLILLKWGKYLKSDGFFLFETGFDTAAKVKKLAEALNLDCAIEKDSGGNQRMAVIKDIPGGCHEP